MNQPILISNRDARRLFLDRQGLAQSPRGKLTDSGLLDMITALGFVQVDSINTVSRAHHMILFARNRTYQSKQLTRLLEENRSLFEHWTHDAAIVPTEYYPYWHHRFEREKVYLIERWRKWRREGFEDIFAEILEKVTLNGPTMARDIGSKQKKGTGWWDWHPEKTALEFHWRTGALSITGRDGFQKIYEITENVIPEHYRSQSVSIETFVDWSCRSALSRLGLATSGEIAAFWNLVTPKEAAAWCETHIADGTLISVVVETAGDGKPTKSLAFSDLTEQLRNVAPPQKHIRVLSPFDPLIRDRKRCLRLFGFDYKIEVFVPEAKRKYGYYVFPLLEGQQFIGRIDMKHFKDQDALVVKGLWLESDIKLGKGRKASLMAELNRYRRFIGAGSLVLEPGTL